MTLQERLSRVKLLALDFDGVVSDGFVHTFADGSEAVRTSRVDGIGIERLKALGVRVVVITGEPQGIVDVRCAKLGLHVEHGEPKIERLRAVAEYHRISLDECAYIGNDVNDLECLQAVGMPFVTYDCHPNLAAALGLSRSWHLSDTAKAEVTTAHGGDGAVREVCDLIADAIEADRAAYVAAKARPFV